MLQFKVFMGCNIPKRLPRAQNSYTPNMPYSERERYVILWVKIAYSYMCGCSLIEKNKITFNLVEVCCVHTWRMLNLVSE